MTKIISLSNISYSIPYSETILKNINLEVGKGEMLGILGHNGAGKTTLMDLLMGFRPVTEGELLVLDENPHAIFRNNKNEVIFLSQDVALKGSLTIAEFLNFHASFYPNYSISDEEHLLKMFNLAPDMKIGGLSTGQQKKVQIIAGFSSRPKLILIDEITAVLDPETRAIFFKELEQVKEKFSTAILLATNIAEDLVDRADRILFISDGKATLHQPLEIINLFNLQKVAS